MFFAQNPVVVSLAVHTPGSRKTETVTVPARPFSSLSFRLSGTAYFNESLCANPGDMTFIPKNCSYTTRVTEKGSIIVAHFDTLEPWMEEPRVFSFDAPRFRQLFTELATASRAPSAFGSLQMSVFYRILHELSAALSAETVPEKMLAVRTYVLEHFSDPEVNVEALARTFRLSPSYLRREFKKSFGTSPMAYLSSVRLDNAKAMLSSGYFSVREISVKCGFESLSYFSAAFKKREGKTPTEYRIGR